jgi:hypothetical protein
MGLIRMLSHESPIDPAGDAIAQEGPLRAAWRRVRSLSTRHLVVDRIAAAAGNRHKRVLSGELCVQNFPATVNFQ